MIEVTANAQEKIKGYLAENEIDLAVRVFVTHGG